MPIIKCNKRSQQERKRGKLLASALAKNKHILILDCDEQRTVSDVLEMEDEMYPDGEP